MDEPLIRYKNVNINQQELGVLEDVNLELNKGEFDYLIKARIPDMRDYRGLLGRILLQLPMAVESRSYVVMEEIKETLYLDLSQ